MKTLHYDIYNNGNVGMCNILMSIENALIIAKLTNRDKIIFYQDLLIFNSFKKLFIQDLFDIKFNIEFRNTIQNLKEKTLLYDFYSSVFYYKEKLDNEFLNGRTNLVDLKEYEDIEDIYTLNDKTLSFYSYLFYFGNKKEEIHEFIKDSIKLKIKYFNIANHYIEEQKRIYGGYNCIAVRRGDYLVILGNKNKEVTVSDFLLILQKNFNEEKLLLVISDENNLEYFSLLKLHYKNIFHLKSILSGLSLDDSEIGLIKLLIGSQSDNFVGTMKSTYTAYIQRYRLYNGLKEDFKYLYTQFDDLQLNEYGRIRENLFGLYTWNRYSLVDSTKQIFFWIKEWDECYKKLNELEQSLRVLLNYLTQEQCDFIKSFVDEKGGNEFFNDSNRNRAILQWENTIIQLSIEKLSKFLNIKLGLFDKNIQIFKQYTHGETKLHVDSVYEDKFGRRTSSILFYLNEDFTGSFIDLLYLGVRIQLKTGTCIIYLLLNGYNQQDKMWSHSASVITSGTKYMCYVNLKEYE